MPIFIAIALFPPAGKFNCLKTYNYCTALRNL
jgi:hypothetical protein